MSARLERATLLLQQARPAEAEHELRQLLAEQPDAELAHAYLAVSLSAQGRHLDAHQAASTAVALAPDLSYAHWVCAHVLHRADREKEALAAVQEALRLAPEDADAHALEASIQLASGAWPEALAAAERALALAPEHLGAANLRSMALVRLNRRAEAFATIDAALARDPNNAFSHANQGWNCLHHNQHTRAQTHFREALRLDPNFEYARQGMLECLRARNWLYRAVLQYFLWSRRQGSRLQWALAIGVYLGLHYGQQAARHDAALGTYLWPVLISFYAFVYLTWTAQPLFNLLLRLDRFGRYVLTADERRASTWFALPFAFGATALGFWLYTRDLLPLVIGLMGAAVSVEVAIVFSRTGRTRRLFGWGVASHAALGLLALALLFTGAAGVGGGLLTVFFITFLLLQLSANFVGR